MHRTRLPWETSGTVEVKGPIRTDAGMWGLWSPGAFSDVVDQDTWDAELLEDDDIKRHIVGGDFVPVNIEGDGSFEFLVRVGDADNPAELSDREQQYAMVTAEPYLLVTDGDAVISGIEQVRARADQGLRVPLNAGRWAVKIFLIEWSAEPGQESEEGEPLPTALPDFVLLVNPEDRSDYRTDLVSFDRD